MNKGVCIGLLVASATTGQPSSAQEAYITLAQELVDRGSPEMPGTFTINNYCLREEEVIVEAISHDKKKGRSWNKHAWNDPFKANNYAQKNMHRYRGNRHNQ